MSVPSSMLSSVICFNFARPWPQQHQAKGKATYKISIYICSVEGHCSVVQSVWNVSAGQAGTSVLLAVCTVDVSNWLPSCCLSQLACYPPTINMCRWVFNSERHGKTNKQSAKPIQMWKLVHYCSQHFSFQNPTQTVAIRKRRTTYHQFPQQPNVYWGNGNQPTVQIKVNIACQTNTVLSILLNLL